MTPKQLRELADGLENQNSTAEMFCEQYDCAAELHRALCIALVYVGEISGQGDPGAVRAYDIASDVLSKYANSGRKK